MKELGKRLAKRLLPSYIVEPLQAVRRFRLGKKKEKERRKKNSRIIYHLLHQNHAIQLEFGASKPRRGFITIDLSGDADLCLDLRKPLPFPDNSVSRIYSSHCLEHFSYSEVISLLKESFRILKSGGSFSVSVPNAAIYLKAYTKPEEFNPDFCKYLPAVHYHSKIDYVNYIAYMDGHHKIMFDEENIVAIFRSTGFSKVEKRGFDCSVDLEERDYESIYAVATK